MSQLKAGATLRGGAYVIKKVLGQGSFGITYLAEHTALGKKVAIKEFFMKDLNSRAEDGSITGMTRGSLSFKYAEKFRKEAANLARMKHPNIVEVTDAFDENGTYYYVMEHIEGENLNDYIKHHRLSEDEAVGIARDIATALQYMHEQHRMLHLDLKPGYVMRRSSDGHIFLFDFGLSKHYSEGGQPETSTTIGLGTAGYAPIEQGSQAKEGDFRPTIDIYALGATLFKLLTGNTPPASSEIAYNADYIPNTLSSAGVSPSVVHVVSNAMAGNPAMRTATAHNFISQLSGNALTIDQTRSDVTITESKSKPKSKSKKGMVLGAIFVIMAVIGAACFYFLQDSTAKYVYDENAPIEQVKADAEKGDAAAQALLSWYYTNGMNKVQINEKEAFNLAKESADQSNPLGQCQLAFFHETGMNTKKDSLKAVDLYKTALPIIQKLAEKGVARAQKCLGTCYYSGCGVKQDYNEAVKWLRLAANQGNADAQFFLAECFYRGDGVEQSWKESSKWFRKAAEQGHPCAQYNLGDNYLFGNGVDQDEEEAIKWFRKAAEQGFAISQNMLGEYYFNKDKEEAIRWYLKSAEHGEPMAQTNLGYCYFEGEGVRQDFNEAVKWYRLAAEQDYPPAQCCLGDCYHEGKGVSKDYNEAVKWYRLAAEQGYAVAQVILGYCYENGNGVAKDYNEAVKWYRLAAEQGNAYAQNNLGVCYENGYGVAKDINEAVKWFKLAAQQGNEVAQQYLRSRGITEW